MEIDLKFDRWTWMSSSLSVALNEMIERLEGTRIFPLFNNNHLIFFTSRRSWGDKLDAAVLLWTSQKGNFIYYFPDSVITHTRVCEKDEKEEDFPLFFIFYFRPIDKLLLGFNRNKSENFSTIVTRVETFSFVHFVMVFVRNFSTLGVQQAEANNYHLTNSRVRNVGWSDQL